MITLIEQQRETGAGLSLAAMCRALEVPRSAYYRARQQPPGDHETAPRDAIQRIALEMPAYGSRRITAELRRQGWVINRKRVQRLMREDNLLCLRRKKFIRTTDSEHGLAVYPNLVPGRFCWNSTKSGQWNRGPISAWRTSSRRPTGRLRAAPRSQDLRSPSGLPAARLRADLKRSTT